MHVVVHVDQMFELGLVRTRDHLRAHVDRKFELLDATGWGREM